MKNKGITLAFSLQSSIRINVTDLKDGNKFILKLIEKAHNEPNIAYVALVDDKDIILAHSDRQVIGKPLPSELGKTKHIPKNRINTRIVPSSVAEERIFEVIEPLIFVPPPTYLPDTSSIPSLESDTLGSRYSEVVPPPDVYWWVIGFRLEKAVFATKTALYKAIASGMLLLIVGSMALYMIFALQRYYLTKETLANTSQSIGKILTSLAFQ